MSFPSSPINGQTTQLNGITYIYNATNNAWKRQTLTDITVSGTVTASNVQVNSGITFNDNSRLTSGLVYDLDEIYPDGTTISFYLRYNSANVTVTNPWNLSVTINGLFQPAFVEGTDVVWLGHALCAYTGYTINSGNLKFSDCPPSGTVIHVRTQPGSTNPTQKIYPFKPVDIMLGM
jgi:hypothetical protein